MDDLKIYVRISLSVIVALGILLIVSLHPIHAQNPDITPYQFGVNATTHIACTITPATTRFCFASDGLWWSNQGAAYVQIGAGGQAGVTSFNGRTGAVLATSGDYNFSQISGAETVAQEPPTRTCVPTMVVGIPDSIVLSQCH